MSNQKETPWLSQVEKGQLIAPPYEQHLVTFDIDPLKWEHVCPCRFGQGRLAWRSADGKSETKWTGDCYRYDIYKMENTSDNPYRSTKWALRWYNGSGSGWLVCDDKNARNQENLLAMICQMTVEERRWDACHFIWEAVNCSVQAAVKAEREKYSKAFIEKRIKKQKIRGQNAYRVTIEPPKQEAVTA